MVSGLSIAAMFFTMLVPLGVLIAALIYFIKKHRVGIKYVLIGTGVFLAFAMILEGLLNRFILVWNPATAAFFKNSLAYAIYGALAAGIFEETGRLVGFKLFFKKSHEWKHGVAYGLGHGGIELVIFGGILAITQINNVVYSVMINNGTFGQLQKVVAKMPSQAAAIETARQQLISLPSWTFFIGGLERIDTLFIQLALSVLVIYAVSKSRYLFYILAVMLHTVIDFTAVFCKSQGMSLLLIEGFITLYAIAALVFVILSRKLFKSNANVELKAI